MPAPAVLPAHGFYPGYQLACLIMTKTPVLLLLSMMMSPAALCAAEELEGQGQQGVDTGTIRVLMVPNREATLSSRMDGLITSYRVDDGDSFNKGDVLLQFDCRERQANLAASAAQLAIAEQTLKSQERLKHLDASSDLDLEVARSTAVKTRAEWQLNQALADRCTIIAPYDGRVVKRLANNYENVAYGTGLLEIIDKDPLRLQLYLPSEWLRWLQPGQSFMFSVDETGARYQGHVTTLGTRVDSVSQTVAVRAEIDGTQQGLLPGMSGSAYFQAPR